MNEDQRQVSAPPASPAALTDEQREKVCEAVADALGGAYDCMRVWSAWGAGTMGSDDFALVAEDDSRVAEIADAAIAATLATSSVAAVPAAPQPSAKALTDEQIIETYLHEAGKVIVRCAHERGDFAPLIATVRALLAAEQPSGDKREVQS